MARRPARELLESLDRDALAQFQAGIRKRYSDEDIVKQLQGSARRLGRSPSMREFAADEETTVHPQTVIEHFGSWNAAKRAAGLVPRRFATREELLLLLRELGERLERTPTARDLDEHRGSMPSKSLYWHTFGSLTTALREAGFDVPVGEERLERAIDQGFEARPAPEVPGVGDGEARRRSAADRVADLPDVRRPPRRLVDVPVPDPRAPARRRLRRLARRAGVEEGRR